MSLRNYFLLKLHSINEQAKELADLYKLADAKSEIILQHLAKIYLNFDKNDNDKHAREMSAEIYKLITSKSKATKKSVKATKLLFNWYLPDNIKSTYTTDDLNGLAIALLPHRYSKDIVLKLENSDFSKRVMLLLHWLDANSTSNKYDIHDKILELFDIN